MLWSYGELVVICRMVWFFIIVVIVIWFIFIVLWEKCGRVLFWNVVFVVFIVEFLLIFVMGIWFFCV